MLPHLEPHANVYVMDRRGHGVDAVVETVLRELAGMSDAELDALRAARMAGTYTDIGRSTDARRWSGGRP